MIIPFSYIHIYIYVENRSRKTQRVRSREEGESNLVHHQLTKRVLELLLLLLMLHPVFERNTAVVMGDEFAGGGVGVLPTNSRHGREVTTLWV